MIPFSVFNANWINGIIDLCMLCLNAVVLRSAISQNLTFFHKLYRAHRYEFHRHVKRELPKQVLLFLSFCLLDVVGFCIIFEDCMYLGCSAWTKEFGVGTFVN